MGEKSIGIVQSLDAVANPAAITAAAPSAATATALTDSTTGTAAATLAAGVGKVIFPLFIDLPTMSDADQLTTLTPGFKGKILSFDFFTHTAVTTGSKASTLNLEIGTTNVTGGVISLASATATPIGAKIAGSAVTATNTFSSSDTISIEATSTTTFIEGSGWLIITLQNMDTADAFASLADEVNKLITDVASIRTQLTAGVVDTTAVRTTTQSILTAAREHELMDS